jgi:phospholipid/cholesterol/gamma-HCH transport system substrate-binding protein
MKISKEFLIGTLVVASIAVLYMGVSYLKGVNVFNKQQRYFAIYHNVAGLVTSNPVVLNGYKIGIVKKVEMAESGDGSILVEVVIDDAKLRVPRDSKLEIYDADLFGSKAIQIILGVNPQLAENLDTLASSIQLGLTESLKQEIEPLKKKTSELFASVDSVLGNLNATFKTEGGGDISSIFTTLKKTLINLEQTTSKVNVLLDNNSGNIGSIMANVNSITDNLKKNNDRITNAVNNFSGISDSLAKMNLNTTLRKVDKAMGDFALITEKINSGKGTMGMLVNNDSLYHELNAASHSLDLLLNDMQKNPKRYVHFSVFGKKDPQEFSKRELEQLREEIDQVIKEKEAKGEK